MTTKTAAIVAALTLTACATTLPDTAPAGVRTAHKQMMDAMRYDYLTEFNSGQEVWTSGCPSVGDCEDVALCLVEKLRAQGETAELMKFSWNDGKTPWAHIMVKTEGGILLDYYGAFWQPNERVTHTHTCTQLTYAKGKASTAGLWRCVPVVAGKTDFMRNVK